MFLNWSYTFLVWKIKFNLGILVHELKNSGSKKFSVWGNLCDSGCFPHCNYVAFVAIIRVCTAKLSFMITQRLVVENFRKLKTQLVCAPLCKQNRPLKKKSVYVKYVICEWLPSIFPIHQSPIPYFSMIISENVFLHFLEDYNIGMICRNSSFFFLKWKYT